MARSREKERKERKKVSARQRVENHQSGFGASYLRLPDGVSFFKVDKAGIRIVDVMPFITKIDSKYAEAGDPYFEKTFWAHRNIGPNQDMVICPAKTAGKRCPICEHRAKLSQSPDGDEDLIADLAPKERQIWLLRDLKEPSKGLLLWDVSYHLFGKLLESRLANAEDEDDNWDAFADLEDGSTLRLTFVDETFAGRTYQKCTSIDFKPRKVQYDADDIDGHPCLDDMLVIKSYEELKKLLLQVDDTSEGDEDEDEPTPKKRSAKASKPVVDDDDDDEPKPAKKKAKPLVDDDDDEDDEPAPWDSDEDEDDEPAPTKKKAKPVVDEDEDEEPVPVKKASKATAKKRPDPDEDDDDEEPAPKKPSKAARKPVDDDEDEEEEPKPTKKKAAVATAGAKKGKADDWDDDWD